MSNTLNRSIRTVMKERIKIEEDGLYNCSHQRLNSLDGAPDEVHEFDCYRNKLTDLVGGPKIVTFNYGCYYNQLTSLKGAAEEVGGHFDCSENKLVTLEGGPKKVGSYYTCEHNLLTSLIGAPAEIEGYFDCGANNLTSLQGIHKYIKSIDHEIMLVNNPLKSHILGLLKIQKLSYVTLPDDLYELQRIINDALKTDKPNIFDVQAKMEDAGFEAFAQL